MPLFSSTKFWHLVAKVETLLLEGPLDAICSAAAIYQTMNRNNLPPYEDVRKIVECAVESSLIKIEDSVRKAKVLEVLPEIESGYKSIVGLNTIKVLNTDKESAPNTMRDEIKQNIKLLMEKLNHPMRDDDISLYDALRKEIDGIVLSDLTWRDLVANMVLSDDSDIVQSLGRRQKTIFMEPCENMKCVPSGSVVQRCDAFVGNFGELAIHRSMENVKHDKTWKEDDSDLIKVTDRILDVLGEIWNNPAFATSTSRGEQSEGTYITDVIVPLLRASLANLPNGYICLSTAERQSIASKTRKNKGAYGERIGKKPDIMGIMKQEKNNIELIYVESSRIICNKTKKDDDDVKLGRETIDGASAISALCRPTSNQFGVVGIQIAGLDMRLNVLVKDPAGIPRYFHLDHAEIPLLPHLMHTKSLIRVLLTLRNVMIVNKSLITQALDQAVIHPPRNISLSTTVNTPPSYNEDVTIT